LGLHVQRTSPLKQEQPSLGAMHLQRIKPTDDADAQQLRKTCKKWRKTTKSQPKKQHESSDYFADDLDRRLYHNIHNLEYFVV
jgi:protein required for attachment to host cells